MIRFWHQATDLQPSFLMGSLLLGYLDDIFKNIGHDTFFSTKSLIQLRMKYSQFEFEFDSKT